MKSYFKIINVLLFGVLKLTIKLEIRFKIISKHVYQGASAKVYARTKEIVSTFLVYKIDTNPYVHGNVKISKFLQNVS